MNNYDDLLAQYRANEAKAEQAVAFEKEINERQSKQQALSRQKADIEKELHDLAGGANDTPENQKEFHSKAEDFKELQSQIQENNQKLKETEQRYTQWKEEQNSKGKEATQETINKDYQDREGKPLDRNVSGYDANDQTQPLNDKSKEQADLMSRYAAKNQNESVLSQQEQHQEKQQEEPER